MNGIEKITARIETDAKAEVAEILREAEEKAAAIREQYKAQAAAEAKAAEAAGKEAAQRQTERLESAAQMEAKKQFLAAKQACLNEAFSKAQEKLLALSEGEYAQLLARMAVKAAKTGKEEILLNARDRERVGSQVAAKANAMLAEAVKPEAAEKAGKVGGRAGAVLSAVVTGASALLQGTAQLTLSQETREMAGGLTLRDGNVEVNCAFETQLRVLREEMAAEVAGILFP
jgi:V/A-type H+-transporting ATPase subunit E